MTKTHVLADFSKDSSLSNWKIVNDGVMGGLSKSKIDLTKEGYARFKGSISLDNNGGFAMVQYTFDEINIKPFNRLKIILKGDTKSYQFRIKSKKEEYYAYVYPIQTSGKWESIEINLSEMYPAFRGRKLNIPNFSEPTLEQFSILIGNKKKEDFELQIDKIVLE
ncbi:CIA30 family protein [Eudoraea chungangensis]|uniref:CIA30 family protein n=1 Tax=Eudoraea chungangensis TaxID=1481905 RepID=UPI0023EC4C92|nr:CIA30 family protein [Eudoraea chungangensis]